MPPSEGAGVQSSVTPCFCASRATAAHDSRSVSRTENSSRNSSVWPASRRAGATSWLRLTSGWEAGGLNLLAEASLRVGEVLLVEEDFGEAEDRSQRRAQRVRHAREEERAIAAHALEFEVGFFEFRRAPAQLLDERLDASVLLA